MTDKQSNHVDMILNVIRVYTDYQVMIDSKAAVGAQFVALKAKQGLIGVAIGGQSGSTATDKALVRADLDEFSFGVMAPVKGWAITQNDVRLRDEMDYSLTELGKEKDDTYVEFLRRRRDLVNGLIGLLGGLGFTTELIEEWDLKIGRYEEAVTDPRQAIINRAVHTENLDKYIKEALGICYVLDDMMVLFKGVALGEVYKKYVMAREIIDLGEAGDGTDGGVEAVINLLFTNGITTVPLVGVEVGLGGSDVRGVTDEAGRVRFSVGPSRYNVVIEAEGFARGNFPVDVPIAGVYSFKFQLRPVG
jgi:hypothetical protein